VRSQRNSAAETNLSVRVQVRGVSSSGLVPQGAGKHLKQILREALSNAARHAGTCTADVSLVFAQDELELIISDNGCGIGVPSDEHSGLGLRNMQERARRLGGRLRVDTRRQGPGSFGRSRSIATFPIPLHFPKPFPAEVMP